MHRRMRGYACTCSHLGIPQALAAVPSSPTDAAGTGLRLTESVVIAAPAKGGCNSATEVGPNRAAGHNHNGASALRNVGNINGSGMNPAASQHLADSIAGLAAVTAGPRPALRPAGHSETYDGRTAKTLRTRAAG
ncbi:hypothetical protein Vafri_20396, partial [Volvox africanus]